MKKQIKTWLALSAFAGIIAGCDNSDKNKSTSMDSTSTDATTTVPSTPTTTTTTDTTRKSTARSAKKGKVTSVMSTAATTAGKQVQDKEGYYSSTEILPAYPGGQAELDKYISNNITYPQEALDNGIEGTVVVSFAVDESGKIYTPTVTSTKLGYGLEEEALKAVASMPVWTPGRIKGKNVKTRYTLPVTFKLEQ
jgi:protein TonB